MENKMSVAEYKNQQKKGSKYGNKKVMIDGINFDSKLESEYYLLLKMLKKAGEIKCFCIQPRFCLLEGFTKNKKRWRPIHYNADFMVIYPDDQVEIIDVKGRETKEFRIKQKLFEDKFMEYQLKIIKKEDMAIQKKKWNLS